MRIFFIALNKNWFMVIIMVYDSKLRTYLFTVDEKRIPVPTSLLWSPLSQNSYSTRLSLLQFYTKQAIGIGRFVVFGRIGEWGLEHWVIM